MEDPVISSHREGEHCGMCRSGRLRWIHYDKATMPAATPGWYLECDRCNAAFSILPDGNPNVSVSGSNAAEVEMVARSLFVKAQEMRPHKRFPFESGLFFLAMFIVLLGTVLVAAKLLPFYMFPLVLIGSILTFSVVGAFMLRQDDSLSEKSFLELMKLSFKYLPLVRKRES